MKKTNRNKIRLYFRFPDWNLLRYMISIRSIDVKFISV